jgi:DNA-binding NarL/FixJ family response regulator
MTHLTAAIIDDDTVVREGLPLLLTELRGTRTYGDVESFLTEQPLVDVVIQDLVLTGTGRGPALHGAAAIRLTAAAGYPVLIYTNERRREALAGCLAAGARGVVHKAESLTSLRNAITAVAHGDIVITPALVGLAEVVERRGSLPALTPRQQAVLSARARGEPFQSIAQRLFISKRTAEDHMDVVARKFADYLRTHSPADLEHLLALGPGDILDRRAGSTVKDANQPGRHT